ALDLRNGISMNTGAFKRKHRELFRSASLDGENISLVGAAARHGRSERTLRLQQNFIFLCRRRGGSLQLYLHRRQLHMQRCCANQHETAQYYCHNTGNSGLSSESYFLFIYSTLDTSFLDYAAHASTNAPQILR